MPQRKAEQRAPLQERQQEILAEIIQYYLQHHEAISARTLSKISRLSLSATTIRNLMEDLSSLGLLTNRGVSRGRIPTQQAFTIYVTSLRAYQPPPKSERLPPPTDAGDDAEDLAHVLNTAAGYLTERTGFVALAALPPRDHYPLDWVRLALAPTSRVLVTVHTLLGDLWSKLVVVPEPLAADLLKAIELHLCQTYRGVALELVRGEIMSGRAHVLQAIAGPEGMAYRLLRRAFEWGGEPGLLTWRTEHLYNIEEFRSAQVLTRLHHALQNHQLVNKALAAGLPVEGGHVAIGTDIGVPGMESAALVSFPFGLNSEWRGRLAVLGPMHMNYSLVIQLLKGSVDYVERRLKDTPVPAHG